MRLNLRNIIFIVVGVAVIAGVLIWQNTTADAPEATETPEATVSGILLEGIDSSTIDKVDVRRSLPVEGEETPTEELVVMTRNDASVWAVDEATNITERDTDQTSITTAISNLATLEYNDRFALSETNATLEAFGLDNPAFTIVLSVGETNTSVYVGGKNPGGSRYYVRLNEDTDIVYLVAPSELDRFNTFITTPPYVPAPTSTPTPYPTANPYSEVEQTATAQVELEATSTAMAEFNATATALAEIALTATPEATSAEG